MSIPLEERHSFPTSYFNEGDGKVNPDKLKYSCDRSQALSKFIWGLTFNEGSLGQPFPHVYTLEYS